MPPLLPARLLPEASGSPWPTGHRFADRVRSTHATVHASLNAGHSRRAIQWTERLRSALTAVGPAPAGRTGWPDEGSRDR